MIELCQPEWNWERPEPKCEKSSPSPRDFRIQPQQPYHFQPNFPSVDTWQKLIPDSFTRSWGSDGVNNYLQKLKWQSCKLTFGSGDSRKKRAQNVQNMLSMYIFWIDTTLFPTFSFLLSPLPFQGDNWKQAVLSTSKYSINTMVFIILFWLVHSTIQPWPWWVIFSTWKDNHSNPQKNNFSKIMILWISHV